MILVMVKFIWIIPSICFLNQKMSQSGPTKHDNDTNKNAL